MEYVAVSSRRTFPLVLMQSLVLYDLCAILTGYNPQVKFISAHMKKLKH